MLSTGHRPRTLADRPTSPGTCPPWCRPWCPRASHSYLQRCSGSWDGSRQNRTKATLWSLWLPQSGHPPSPNRGVREAMWGAVLTLQGQRDQWGPLGSHTPTPAQQHCRAPPPQCHEAKWTTCTSPPLGSNEVALPVPCTACRNRDLNETQYRTIIP